MFRFLENRSKIDWTNRVLYADSALGSLAAGVSGVVNFDDGSGANIDWLVSGMVFLKQLLFFSGISLECMHLRFLLAN